MSRRAERRERPDGATRRGRSDGPEGRRRADGPEGRGRAHRSGGADRRGRAHRSGGAEGGGRADRSEPGPPSRRRLGPLGFGLLLVVPIAAAAVLLVWTRVTALRIGYEIAAKQSALVRVEEERRVLETEASALRSPERLRKLARDRFGLAPPTAGQTDGAGRAGRSSP